MAAVLVVDDDKNQLLLLTEELAGEGYTVRAASNGQEALASIAERGMPDLAVLDIAMPGMDGLELLSRLLAIDHRLPVVIYTAYASYKDSFMSWSADAYVVKASDLTELKNAVRCALARQSGAQAQPPRQSPPAG